MSGLLEVRDLRVAYGKVEALHGLSLNVPSSTASRDCSTGAAKSRWAEGPSRA